MSQSSHIKYQDAIQLLKSMFINIDIDVIISILELNQGHLERSIDNLLSIDSTNTIDNKTTTTTTGRSNTTQQQQPVYVEPVGVANSTPHYNDANSYIESNRVLIPSNYGYNKRASKKDDYITSLSLTDNLPDDFLRPPSWYQHQQPGDIQRKLQEQDAILAQLLQDQIFMRGIRENPSVLFNNYGDVNTTRQIRSQDNEYKQSSQSTLLQSRQSENKKDEEPGSSDESTSLFPSFSSNGYKELGQDENRPQTTELSFSEKISLLGEEAKRKLASFFDGGDAPRFNNPTSYKSLPTLDDETRMADEEFAENEMTEFKPIVTRENSDDDYLNEAPAINKKW